MKTIIQLNKENSNLIMSLVIVSLISIALLIILISEKDNPNCDVQMNESYIEGYNQGIEVWNGYVIYKLQDNKIPYFYYNGTEKINGELNITNNQNGTK